LKILKRAWIPLVVVVALAVGGFAVDRLHRIFPIISSTKLDPRGKTPPYAR
jgi:Mycobacterium membrane protein